MTQEFFWGNSSSSMQTEGATHEGGKGPSTYDLVKATAHTSDWNDGIDAYHRYEEDISLMRAQGMNCYRFQISWSRVCPTGDGAFNEEGIQFYHRLVDALIKAGIQPYVCLYHFDMPLALAKKANGFLSKTTIDAFVRYAERMVDEFGDQVKLWMTFNEQNFTFMDYGHVFGLGGSLDKTPDLNRLYQIGHNILIAHARVANYIHAHTDAKIGVMLAYQQFYPLNSLPENNLLCTQLDELFNQVLLTATSYGHYPKRFLAWKHQSNIQIDASEAELEDLGQCRNDFIAFSYYQTTTLNVSQLPQGENQNLNLLGELAHVHNPYLKRTQFDWEIDPIGFENVLIKLGSRYEVPIFPVENGLGAIEQVPDDGTPIQDDYRIDFHRRHIQAMQAAMQQGANVIGYLGWGLIDIPSSSGDMNKRYGTVYVNRTNHDLKDMKRVPKKSFYWFKQVIESNGQNLSDIEEGEA